MRKGLRLAVVLALLAGCGGGPVAPLRDPGVPLTSLALFDPARMAGEWHLAAAFAGDVGCGPVSERWAPRGDGSLAVTGSACRDGRRVALDTVAMPSGPGRFTRRGAQGAESLWILWADADNRIAVVGTPDGSFGRVLTREPVPRGDLMQAARDVLDFNGYDLARLTPATP